MTRDTSLKITEVFYSLQGESNTVGLPTVFVRLTGCPLRCVYCDTEYAFTGGERMSQADILATVAGFNAQHVTVTGGEPLAQPACLPLLTALCDAGYAVSLETSGALAIAAVDPRVSRVMDLKTPASAECHRNKWDNVPLLTMHDQVKFVIADRVDYEWSVDTLRRYNLVERTQVLFSPSHGVLAPRQLAEWVLADRLSVRMQVQLHKVIWGEEPGR